MQEKISKLQKSERGICWNEAPHNFYILQGRNNRWGQVPVAVSFCSEIWPFIFKVLFTKCAFTWCIFYKHLPANGVIKTVQFNETISSSDFQSFRKKWDHKVWSALNKTVKNATCIAHYIQVFIILDWLRAPESHWVTICVPSGQLWGLPGQVEGDSKEHILFLKEHWRMWEQGSIPRNPPWWSQDINHSWPRHNQIFSACPF